MIAKNRWIVLALKTNGFLPGLVIKEPSAYLTDLAPVDFHPGKTTATNNLLSWIFQ
jgi:hypothetical protein